jgi:hypothetical protein
MPVELKGLGNTQRAMRKFTPGLYQRMNAEISAVMLPVRDEARNYVPLKVLSKWQNQTGVWALSDRTYNAITIKKGIVYRRGRTKANDKGFRSSYRIVNTTAAGAIYETAGRKNPSGQPWVGAKGKGGGSYSHSDNPRAGLRFINSLGGQLVGADKFKGRLIYRAWAKQNGKVIPSVINSINYAILEFNKAAKP